MPKLEYFIVCESASIDIETDKLSLFNVLEDVFPDQFPEHIKIEAVSLWNVDPEDAQGDFQATLRIKPPGMIQSPPFPMNLSRGRLRHRAHFAIRNIPLVEPGQLTFELLLNGQHSASHTVTIHPIEVKIGDGGDEYRPTS